MRRTIFPHGKSRQKFVLDNQTDFCSFYLQRSGKLSLALCLLFFVAIVVLLVLLLIVVVLVPCCCRLRLCNSIPKTGQMLCCCLLFALFVVVVVVASLKTLFSTTRCSAFCAWLSGHTVDCIQKTSVFLSTFCPSCCVRLVSCVTCPVITGSKTHECPANYLIILRITPNSAHNTTNVIKRMLATCHCQQKHAT